MCQYRFCWCSKPPIYRAPICWVSQFTGPNSFPPRGPINRGFTVLGILLGRGMYPERNIEMLGSLLKLGLVQIHYSSFSFFIVIALKIIIQIPIILCHLHIIAFYTQFLVETVNHLPSDLFTEQWFIFNAVLYFSCLLKFILFN